MSDPKTYATLGGINEGGAYVKQGDVFVRVQEPTAVQQPADTAAAAPQGAEAGPGVVVGATTGEPPARVEAASPAAPSRKRG